MSLLCVLPAQRSYPYAGSLSSQRIENWTGRKNLQYKSQPSIPLTLPPIPLCVGGQRILVARLHEAHFKSLFWYRLSVAEQSTQVRRLRRAPRKRPWTYSLNVQRWERTPWMPTSLPVYMYKRREEEPKYSVYFLKHIQIVDGTKLKHGVPGTLAMRHDWIAGTHSLIINKRKGIERR